MVNLLDGRGFIGASSSESEGHQQPIKVSQASNVDRRGTEGHRRANGTIEHPGGEDDRNPRCSLNDDDISPRSLFSVELPDLPAMKRVPAVMDRHFLADMGRMAPR
jgi:hypothetical protein